MTPEPPRQDGSASGGDDSYAPYQPASTPTVRRAVLVAASVVAVAAAAGIPIALHESGHHGRPAAAPPAVTGGPQVTPPGSAVVLPAPVTGGSQVTPAPASGGQQAAPATEVVAVPVVVCPTVEGVSDAVPGSVAPTATVMLPTRLVGTVAFYADDHSVMRVLAPLGWVCHAIDAGDQSSGVTVSPATEDLPQGVAAPVTADSALLAVVADQTAGCAGCTVGQACSLFPAAAAAYREQFSRPCGVARPPGEVVDRINSALVGFEDPPGVSGAGYPSGGRYPTNGVMTYDYPANPRGSWTESCTMPESDHGLCIAVLDTFIATPRPH